MTHNRRRIGRHGTGEALCHAGWCDSTQAIPMVKDATRDRVIAAAGTQPRRAVHHLVSTTPTEGLELLDAINYPPDGRVRSLLAEHAGYVVIAYAELAHHPGTNPAGDAT